MNEKEKITLDIKINNITVAQALAINEMFKQWERFGDAGCSRQVSFMVDGDGDFHPEIQTIFSQKPNWKYFEIAEKFSTPKNGEGCNFDYDNLYYQIRLYEEERMKIFTSNKQCNEECSKNDE